MNQGTPLAVDAYSRFMAALFDEAQIIGVPTAFQAFFGRPENGGLTLFSPDANIVDIDIVRGSETLAALIHRGQNARSLSGQKNTNIGKSSTFSRLYPLIEEEGDISADELNFRVAGEGPYSPLTKFDRLRIKALRHHQAHIRRSVRTFEYLSSLSVLTGKMPAILGTSNTDLEYDFRRNAANTAAGAAVWDTGTPDIMGDVDGRCDKVRLNGHANPDMGIFGGEAIASFIKDTTIKSLADNRRIELIQVTTDNPVPPRFDRFVKAGFIPRGRLRTLKGYTLWIFCSIDEYIDPATGTSTPYMPVDQCLVAASTARCDRYFGPSELLPNTPGRAALYQDMFGFAPGMPPMPPNIKNMAAAVNPAMFYNDAYMGANQKTITIRTQSAPIFATTQTDAFALLTDLST